jgi:DNA-binding GntR family transcriptional regulator
MDDLGELAAGTLHRPKTVADRIADTLREGIARGALAAGTPLRQDDLAARFGFSRMPIRDALRQLEAEGLVTIHPTRGAAVARMDAVEIAEVYAIRSVLEAEALRLSVRHLVEADLAEAEAVLDQIDAEPDVRRWGQLNRAFHLRLYGACGNSRLLALIEAQQNLADRYVRILLSSLDYRLISQTEHRAILAACRSRDTDAAVALLRRHLDEGSRTLVGSIA